MKWMGLMASAGLIASLAGAAMGGDVIFTVEFGSNPNAPANTIGLWSNGSTSTLVTFTEVDTRLADIVLGGDGNYYVSNSPFPIQQMSTAQIVRVQGLLSGAPVVSTLAMGGRLSNMIGLSYDPLTNNVLALNNPGGTEFPDDRYEGVLGIDIGTGVVTPLFEEPPYPPMPRPAFQAGAYIAPDPRGNGHVAVSFQGGEFGREFDGGSQLYRVTTGPGPTAVVSLLVDLSDTSVTGLAASIDGATGITSVPGTDSLFITDRMAGAIFRVDLNPDGTFNSIHEIATGLGFTEEIEYDPFDNKLVFDNILGVSRMNLDGTGFEVLVPDIHVRGIVVIPGPGAAAGLLVAGGLFAGRRRR